MLRNKIQKLKSKNQNRNLKSKNFLIILNFGLSFWILVFGFWILLFAQGEFTYDAKGKRNPFIPLVTPDGRLLKLEEKEDKENLILEGIIYDKRGLSYAVINGQIVKIGDKVGDYQVFKIEENKVIFLREGEPLEVELKKEEP